MQMTLAVPFCLPDLIGFEFGRWLVSEGDAVAVGTDLCEIRATSRERVGPSAHRVKKPKPRSFRLLRRPATATESHVRTSGADLPIGITADEPGVVSRLLVAAGEQVQVDTPIAIIEVGPDEGVGGRFHATANVLRDGRQDDR